MQSERERQKTKNLRVKCGVGNGAKIDDETAQVANSINTIKYIK